jgi:hypothetical protein
MLAENIHFLGIDLGQSRDHTAVAAVAREQRNLGADPATYEPVVETAYSITGIRRLPLGLSYPAIISEIQQIRAKIPGRAEMVVDATGVGAPVIDLLRERQETAVVPVIFTAGGVERYERGAWRVPKKDLVHGLLITFEASALRIPKNHAHAALLIDELKKMSLKVTGNDHAAYESWREGDHDDMVFALALAVWRARRSIPDPMEGRRPLLW